MSSWTLVIWSLGGAAGQNVVIPGFSSRETCVAAAQSPLDVRYHRVLPDPPFVICVEVK